ncbi:MAG TPA: hypothetical protein VFT16_05555 [Candidatus Saccharimonadales bacterium]|nr:hypothetical protein [Candidatus Saccharimonadales bacterium]
MKQFARMLQKCAGVVAGIAIVAGSTAGVAAAPAQKQLTPPSRNLVSGPQAKMPRQPGTNLTPSGEKLGPTQQAPSGNSVTPLAGSVSGVDFQSFYNYCYRNFIYTPIRNTTASTKYFQVVVYNQGSSHTYYGSVAANSYAYPYYYGIDGSYTAYLYVWNGTSYQYDETSSSNNTCNVSVSRVYNTGGWVQLKIQNTGTAYATQVSSELAPYPGSGTYTGTQYDYPVAGGAAIYRWFYVGTSPYGITSYTSGSSNTPAFFTGDL